jgi:multidrug efflux system outer membrane protein
MKLRYTPLLLAFAALALSSCTLAPGYERPVAPVAENWPSGPAYPAGLREGRSAGAIVGRDFIVDPQLRQVIELALANNRDLKVAALNVEKYRAAYRIERSALLPAVNGTAGAIIQQVPATLSGTGSQEEYEQYSVGLGVSAYELDLFGRLRSLGESALEEYLATDEARRGAQSSLVAAVAEGWLTLAADREQLDLARQTVESRQASLTLIRKRADAGISSALDLQQAKTTVEAARVARARYTRLVAQDENRLTLLLGVPLPVELVPEKLAEETALLREVAPGLPAETLLARPDIIAAEHRLKGANANIGAARAAFFPRLTLTGSVGLGSDDLGKLFDSGAGAWSFVPQLTMPIFTAGSNLARLKVSKVEKEIAVANYEKAIQTAFREVADALAERGTIDEQLEAQQSLTEATTESFRLSQARYDKGVDSYLTLLDAQRSLFAAQQELIATRLARLTNRVTLYKVLGGGAGE